MIRTRFVWLLGVLLVLAGFFPVLLFVTGTLVPGAEASAVVGLLPDVPGLNVAEGWLFARQIRWAPSSGFVYAVAGFGLLYLGAALARSQRTAREAMTARTLDAQRRRRQYGPIERIEPTLGPAD